MTKRKKVEKPKNKSKAQAASPVNFSALRLAGELGFTITIPLIILALAGRLVDKHYHTSPLFLLIGIFLSLIISTYGIFRTVNPVLKELDQSAKEKKSSDDEAEKTKAKLSQDNLK